MAEIIASTYEVLQKIGSGGGGVVYLAKHLRLDKLVVLKADKRTLETDPEILRREVDSLKNLTHEYIPQVYDFISEDGIVYTVMDYIQGESLDKPLRRGEKFSQPQIIKMACQVLKALVYLHSRPPHGILHADIKPANIMLTPEGDIRLIDYNIALALGEKGAVRIGFSRGYASPEHYSSDIAEGPITRGLMKRNQQAAEADAHESEDLSETVNLNAEHELTEVFSDDTAQEGTDKTVRLSADSAPKTGSLNNSGSSSGAKQDILLDVRSDIYSLGATLYHLITGERPAPKAEDVQPINDESVSPLVVAIISKSMAPDPEQRYQTAEEMLRAFEHLHENDSRTKKYKRTLITVSVVSALMLCMGGFTSFVGLKQMERIQNSYVLSELSADALKKGDVSSAVNYAIEALPQKLSLFEPVYTAAAKRALSNALGVYNVSDTCKPHGIIQLDSAPYKVTMSPDGTKTAIMLQGKLQVYDTENGSMLCDLPAGTSALADIVFVNDDVLIYAGDSALRCFDIAQRTECWHTDAATAITMSSDCKRIAALYKDDDFAKIYDAETGEELQKVSFDGRHQKTIVNDILADPEYSLFKLSKDGEWLAVSFSDGSLWVYNLLDSERDLIIYDESDFVRFEGGFRGSDFAFAASNSDSSVFAVIDLENMVQLGAFEGTTPFRTQADENGIYVSYETVLVELDPYTGIQTERAYVPSGDIESFSVSENHAVLAIADGGFAVFGPQANCEGTFTTDKLCSFICTAAAYVVTGSIDMPSVRISKVDSTVTDLAMSYDPQYKHDEIRYSEKYDTYMLFRYDSFRIYRSDGVLAADVIIPDAEQVYDQQFRRTDDGDILEVIYYDGTVRQYVASDGTLVQTLHETVPDRTLYEELVTENYLVRSLMNEAPMLYDRESGELIMKLSSEDYLAYITEVGEYLITEYINGEGERYGLLLNKDCETIADLPNLCDVLPDGSLLFDDAYGNIRRTRIYSIEELMALANK